MSNIQKPDSEIMDVVGFIQKGGKIKPFLKDIFLIETYVAGLYYVDYIDDIFPLIRVKDKLEYSFSELNSFLKLSWSFLNTEYCFSKVAIRLSSFFD